MTPSKASTLARPAWRRPAKLALKAALAVLVLGAVGRHVVRTWRDLHDRGGSVHVEPGWVVLGGLLYLAGLSACGVFYARVLQASATPIGTRAAVRAYLISHLGKYVPGKAMVVVMRVGLSTPFGARAATAGFATFYETLVMMAAGSLVAAVGLAAAPGPPMWVWLAVAAGLAAAFLVVVEPRVFPRISQLATLPFPGVGPDAQPRYTRRLLVEGLGLALLSWTLLGLSQVAVVRAVAVAGVSPRLWPVVAAGVALATVAGFVVAVLPGGLGVREGVLMATLAPALGDDTAVIAALALRLTWVAAEVVVAAVLTPGRSRPADQRKANAEAEAEPIAAATKSGGRSEP